MKFLNKKEQVFDIQLTPYGKHKLSAGDFTPAYYAFFDDNVIYDLEYVGGSESQNQIHKRIKQETQYLEGQVSFRGRLAGSPVAGGILEDTIYNQEENLLTTGGFIGNASFLAEETNVAPAWKIVTMVGTNYEVQNNFTGSLNELTSDVSRAEAILTQLNITASYVLSSESPSDVNRNNSFENFRDLQNTTGIFSDDRIIKLTSQDPLFYIEELNTELLTENFDIEVFKIVGDDFQRLSFKSKEPQVVNGLMVSAQPETNENVIDTNSVEYYFSIFKDSEVDSRIACKYIDQFNTESYLIDLDHDCTDVNGEDLYFDIYGRVTESEICQE